MFGSRGTNSCDGHAWSPLTLCRGRPIAFLLLVDGGRGTDNDDNDGDDNDGEDDDDDGDDDDDDADGSLSLLVDETDAVGNGAMTT